MRRRAEEASGREGVIDGLIQQVTSGFLLQIFEQEKDWKKAIETSRKMDSVSGQSSARDIAHFYCELAAVEVTHSRWDQARDHLSEALSVNRRCARANILLGDTEMGEGRPQAAIEYWKGLESQNPAYIALIAEKFLAAHRSLGREDEGLQLLRGLAGLDIVAIDINTVSPPHDINGMTAHLAAYVAFETLLLLEHRQRPRC